MSSRAYIRTITGDISPGEATAALTHEHFLCHFRRDPLPPARLAELETLLTRDLRHLRSAGCNMLVDAGTMLGYWRPMELYRRLSQQTGVYVVACTGGYVEDCIPPALRRLSVSRLATFLRKEIVEGIEGTGIRAGVIKVASARTLQPAERRMFRAAVIAHRATGMPITCHTVGSIDCHMEFFEKADVDPAKVTLGHMETNPWHRIPVAARKGFMLAFTNLGGDLLRIPEAVILAQVASLVRMGFAKQVLLSTDFTYRVRGRRLVGDWDARYDYVLRRAVPRLRKMGVPLRALDLILHENPRRALCH